MSVRKHAKPKTAILAKRARAAPRVSMWVVGGLLALGALIAYSPAWHGGFLWDDDGHITRLDLRSLQGLWRIWFSFGATQQYYPLTHSAFWLEHRLWGDDPFGYHIVSIALHACSATLVAAILRRLNVRGWFLAAAVFALHPIQVESVAWISELKNTLSGVFYFGAALSYLEFDRGRRKAHYTIALILFACALFSKSVTVTLPVALAIVLWWRKGSLTAAGDLLPLTPFAVLGGAVAAITVWFEAHLIGAQGAAFQLGLLDRCLIAGRAVWFYAVKAMWPANLIFIYPRWHVSPSTWWQWLFPVTAVVAIALLWTLRQRSRGPLACALFFLVTLAPALGFVDVYPFRFSFVADHFQYVAILGIIVPLAAAAATIGDRYSPMAKRTLAFALCGALGVFSFIQSGTYVSAETLYRHTISRNPEATLARSNLAALLLDNGSPSALREAVEHTRAALGVEPGNIEARVNLALALERLGEFDSAATEYAALIEQLQPGDISERRWIVIHHGAGRTLKALGRSQEAIVHYRWVLEHAPADADTQADLGIALAQSGQSDEALTHLLEACRLNPASALYLNNLGAFYLQHGRLDEAIKMLSEAVRLDPSFTDAQFNLAQARTLQRVRR